MKRFMNRGHLLIFIALTLNSASSAPYGQRRTSPPPKPEVPIQGAVSGEVRVRLLSESLQVFRVESSGAGTMSHLGRVEAVWAIPEVEVDWPNQQLIVGTPDWVGTITTVSGDQIFGEYTFPESIIPVTPFGDLTFEARLRITGGTGRFENASGEAVSAGTANIFTGTFNIQVRGTIATGPPR